MGVWNLSLAVTSLTELSHSLTLSQASCLQRSKRERRLGTKLLLSFVSTAKGRKGTEGMRGPKGIRGRPGRPGPAIFFDSSEEVITIKGEKVS